MKNKEGIAVKTTFWGAAVFYLLIAFEFAYMAGPFAFYFYSVYSPALNFFNQSPLLAWLISFFFPHVVRQTSSSIINIHEIIGGIMAVLGFLGFCFGACQVYYHKLAKKGAVTGGVYNFIRHPQYASFIMCSLGLLILWPRYIVLVMFITMIFVYYFLAKSEEKECEEKFGQSYIDYKNKTNMFFPVKLPFVAKLPSLPKPKLKKFLALLAIYVATQAIAIGIAVSINYLSINSLYALYTESSANIAVCQIESEKLENVINIALMNEEIKDRMKRVNLDKNQKFLNYILPTQWYAAEIPMNGYQYRKGHKSPSNYNKDLYKVIFTKADLRSKDVTGKDILINTLRREPIIEVWVDTAEQKVVEILGMPKEIKYDNIPVAIY